MRLSLRCWVGIGHRRWRQGSVAVACESLRGGAAVWIMRAAGLRARTMKDCIVPRSRVGPSASRRWTGAVGRRWCECCRGPPEHRRAVERRCWRFGKVSYHTGHRLAFHKTLACTFGGGAASGQRRQRDGGTHCPVPWFWRRAQGPHSGTAVRGSPPPSQPTGRQAHQHGAPRTRRRVSPSRRRRTQHAHAKQTKRLHSSPALTGAEHVSAEGRTTVCTGTSLAGVGKQRSNCTISRQRNRGLNPSRLSGSISWTEVRPASRSASGGCRVGERHHVHSCTDHTDASAPSQCALGIRISAMSISEVWGAWREASRGYIILKWSGEGRAPRVMDGMPLSVLVGASRQASCCQMEASSACDLAVNTAAWGFPGPPDAPRSSSSRRRRGGVLAIGNR